MFLKDSQTKDHLMRAFAGESQARNRYVFAAQQAKKQGLHVIEAVFKFTADQEQAHAKVYYDLLRDMAGEMITVDGGYPVDIHDSMVKLLRSAQHNEFLEWEHDYKHFGDIAKQEGLTKEANAFHMIAEVEKTHGERFGHFADLMDQNKLFVADMEVDWMCLNCGYIFKGKQAPAVCPVCKEPQGFFIRLELAPFAGKNFGR